MFLKMLPTAWCAWQAGKENHLSISEDFSHMFGLDPSQKLSVFDLFSTLDLDQFSPARKAIQHLVDYGGAFDMQITTQNTLKEIHISGKSISLDCYDLGNHIIALTFQDLTEQRFTQKKQDREFGEILRENKTLNAALDGLPVAVWYRDKEGRIYYCNRAYAAALDTNKSRVVAENINLIDTQQTNLFTLSKQAIANSEKTNIRARTVIHGQRRLLDIAETPAPDHKGETTGYAIDITEVEDTYNERTALINGYENVLNQLAHPIAIYGGDTRLEYFNSAYLKLFHFNEDFLMAKPTLGEILDDLRSRRRLPEYADFKAHRSERMRMFTDLMETKHELSNLPDGTTLNVWVSPHPSGGLIYLFDNITDRLKLERGFNTLIAVQRETIDHLFEGIMVIGSDLRIRLSNPALDRVWKTKADSRQQGAHFNEWVEAIAKKFINGEQLEGWQQQIMTQFTKREPLTNAHKLKRDRRIEYSYVPLPDGSHMLSFVDISDRWRYEKALKNRNRTLETVDKAKSDFISHVSYELKAPLSTITGFSDMLLNEYFGKLNDKQTEYCREIHNSADKLIQLLNDIIDLTSIETGKLVLNYSDINIQKFVKSTISLIESRANDQGVELSSEIEQGIERFKGDEKRLKHALFNLLSNAIKYTPNGGNVQLLTRKNQDSVEFIVRDDGVGTEPVLKKRLQKMFHGDTAEREKFIQSNQLGLPLVTNLIHLHQGKIDLQDPGMDKGMEISCSIPFAPNNTAKKHA